MGGPRNRNREPASGCREREATVTRGSVRRLQKTVVATLQKRLAEDGPGDCPPSSLPSGFKLQASPAILGTPMVYKDRFIDPE